MLKWNNENGEYVESYTSLNRYSPLLYLKSHSDKREIFTTIYFLKSSLVKVSYNEVKQFENETNCISESPRLWCTSQVFQRVKLSVSIWRKQKQHRTVTEPRFPSGKHRTYCIKSLGRLTDWFDWTLSRKREKKLRRERKKKTHKLTEKCHSVEQNVLNTTNYF